jgi:UDP-N-acetylglucosamine 2-epimerase (non-hydrolysing)
MNDTILISDESYICLLMKDDQLTILTVMGTRPEVIKLFPVIFEITRYEFCENIVITSSQHREMTDGLFELFSILPCHDLNIMKHDQSLADITIAMLEKLPDLLRRYKPHLVIVQGDTTSAYAGALAAFYEKIAVGHVEAGLRSFDRLQPYPEEMNRKMISSIAELHFAPTRTSAENLVKENVISDHIFITGNTAIDAQMHILSKSGNRPVDFLPLNAVNGRRMLLVTCHRRENQGKPLIELCLALRDLTKTFDDIEIVYPVHLNPNVREIAFKVLGQHERIHLIDPLDYELFLTAMQKAYLIITDSGGLQEEGLTFKKPILVFREVTERPEGIASGSVKLVQLNRQRVVDAVSFLLSDDEAYKKMIPDRNPYGDGKAAKRIVQAILYYFNKAERPQDFNMSCWN